MVTAVGRGGNPISARPRSFLGAYTSTTNADTVKVAQEFCGEMQSRCGRGDGDLLIVSGIDSLVALKVGGARSALRIASLNVGR